MAFDFPASPTNGQTVDLAGIRYQWNGYAWIMQSGNIGPTGPQGPQGPKGDTGPQGPMGSITGMPSDGNEYVAVNGVWRLKSQRYTPSGTAGQNIAVPSTAKAARVYGQMWQAAAPLCNVGFRASADGSTFPAGATDYTYSGMGAYGGSSASPFKVAHNSASQWPITPSTDSTTISHVFELDLTVNKPNAAALFTAKWRGMGFQSAATVYMIEYAFTGYIANTTINALTQLPAFQLIPMTGSWVAGSLINVDWVY